MEWTVGTTEQHAARCATTRASPRRSASSRPPVVTMIKTAFSPIAVLIVGLPRPVKPHGAREKGDPTEQKAADHVGLPVHVEVQAVESDAHNDRDPGRAGQGADDWGLREPAHEQSERHA